MASVEFITYNEKRYPIKLGVYSLMILQNRDGVSLDEIVTRPELYKPILFMALQQGAKITKQKLDLLEEDMDIVLDECFIEFTTLFPKFFPEDVLEKLMEDGGIVEAVEAEAKKTPVKKKSTTQKSQPKQ